MNRPLRFVFAVLILMLSATQSGPLSAGEFDRVDRYLAQFGGDGAPGLAVAISKDGETVYRGNFGLANLEHRVPINNHTRFHIASVSKQFTAFAIMLLKDEGKLSLSDDIRLHLPELQPTAVPVTINNLLAHTSGLREHNTLWGLIGLQDGDALSPAQALRLLERQEGSNFVTGASREYSNTGYFLLAQIVARISGQSFAEFAEQRIFAPLGMNETFVRDETANLIPQRARSYYPAQQGFRNAGFDSAMVGSTGLITTTGDMMIWARNFEERHVGSGAVFEDMARRTYLENGQLAIGANGQEFRRYRGFDTWSHGGRTGAYRTFLMRVPGARLSIMIAGNRSDIDSAKIAFWIVDQMLANENGFEQASEPSFEKESGAELDRYTGHYQPFMGTVYSITNDGTTLYFSANGSEPQPVKQVGPASFLLYPSIDGMLDFVDYDDGSASELRTQIGLHGFIPAPRLDMVHFDPEMVRPAEYTGTYYSQELQTVMVVKLKDDTLILEEPRAKESALTAYQPDTFRPKGGSYVGRLKFQRDDTGTVTTVLVSGPLANDIPFVRIDLPAG